MPRPTTLVANVDQLKLKMRRSDTEIKQQGFTALTETLGMVDAERFITLIQREPFNYTIWQRTLFKRMNIKVLSNVAMKNKKTSSQSFP